MATLYFSSAQAMLPTKSDADVPQLEKPLILKKKLPKTEQQRLELSGTRKWGYWWGTACFGCCNDEATTAERLAQVFCAKAWQDLQPPIFSCEDNSHPPVLNQRQQKKNWVQEQLALKAEAQSQLEKLFYNDLKDHGLEQLQAHAHRFWGNRNIELSRIESRISEILSRQKQRMLEEAEQKELEEELTGLRQEFTRKIISAAFYRAAHWPNFVADWITCLDRGNICGKESWENLKNAIEFWQTAYGPHSVLQQLLEVMHQPHSRALLPHQEDFEGLLPELNVQSSQYTLSAFDEEGDLENRSKSEEVRRVTLKEEFQSREDTIVISSSSSSTFFL
jgi:broad specificity phosphatase PhoE